MTTPLRIAVADDEPEMREFFGRLLPHFGHEVVAVAANGAQLAEECRQVCPDLVITDIMMPKMDGIEATRQICRERPVPVILVSACHDPAILEKTDTRHIMAYLVKPIGVAELQPAIALAVRRFAELQSLQKECADLRQALSIAK